MGNKVTVEGERQPCTGVAPMTCLVVNGELHYGGIENYQHEDGKRCSFRVQKIKIKNPPADGSSEILRRVGLVRCRQRRMSS